MNLSEERSAVKLHSYLLTAPFPLNIPIQVWSQRERERKDVSRRQHTLQHLAFLPACLLPPTHNHALVCSPSSITCPWCSPGYNQSPGLWAHLAGSHQVLHQLSCSGWPNTAGMKKEPERMTCQLAVVSSEFLKKTPSPASSFLTSLTLKCNLFLNPI